MILEFISNNGKPAQIQVDQLLRVDGQPFKPTDDMSERMAYLEGRMGALESSVQTLYMIASQRVETYVPAENGV